MDTAVFLNGKIFSKVQFHKEDVFEKIIYDNSKLLFGSKTILIEKRMIKTINLGHSIPDGFLFDFNDINNPQFYLIEVELSSHKFYEHIFPQLTKFIAFFKEDVKFLVENILMAPIALSY